MTAGLQLLTSTEPAPKDAADDVLGPNASRAEERIFENCDRVVDIAAALFNVSGKELRSPARGGLAVSRVRQIAMYIAHVVLGLSMNEIGRGFGRDRTTVMHACHLIEDMRDDEEFEVHVRMMERIVEAALKGRLQT